MFKIQLNGCQEGWESKEAGWEISHLLLVSGVAGASAGEFYTVKEGTGELGGPVGRASWESIYYISFILENSMKQGQACIGQWVWSQGLAQSAHKHGKYSTNVSQINECENSHTSL